MDAMILLVAYLTDILRKSLNISGYAKMVKFGFCHGIRTMILALDHPKCIALPFFYAFSRCDTAPSFSSKGKNKEWNVWMQNRSDFDELFIHLVNRPSDVTEVNKNAIESFVMRCTRN